MPFIKYAQQLVAQPGADTALRLTVKYLLDKGVGHTNAQPTENILEYLRRNKVSLSKEEFQQTILKQTREGELFIGSSNRGYYLIANQQDAEKMRDFYQERIATEKARLAHLTKLAEQEGWQI